MKPPRVYVLELKEGMRWRPIASGVVKANVAEHRKNLIAQRLWRPAELRIVPYGPVKGTGVDR